MYLNKTGAKKILRNLAICTTSLSLVLAIDISLAKTNYSLAGLYKIGCAVMCWRNRAPSCHPNSKAIAQPIGMRNTGIG